MSEPTCLSASIVADTIMRTIELGVTITDAGIDDEVTVVFWLFAVSSGIDADWVCSAGSGGCRPTVPCVAGCRGCGIRMRSARRA